MKSILQNNNMEMRSTHNEEKHSIAERFIRTSENKIYKYMTSVSKNAYINKLDDIMNKYNNSYHSTIKMKYVEIKSSTYIDSSKEIVGTFYQKESLKTNQKEFRVEKVTKRKDDKLYVKWKGCDSCFNSWIAKKEYFMNEYFINE